MDLYEAGHRYPKTGPSDLFTLSQMDNDEIRSLTEDELELDALFSMRRIAIQFLFENERNAIGTPEALHEALKHKSIETLPKAWIVYTLDRHRTRRLIQNPPGAKTAFHYETIVSRKVPSLSQLNEHPLLQEGRYLFIFGGSPKDISKEEAELLASYYSWEDETSSCGIMIADICFWELVPQQPPILYSIRAGVGYNGMDVVEFPNQDMIRLVKGS
jgi:hypothetical protein